MTSKIICLLSVFFVLPLKSEPREVACRFMYFGAEGAPPTILASSPDGVHVPCMTPTAAFSQLKKYLIENNTLRLVTEDKKTLTNVAIRPNSDSVFIIIVQTAKEPVVTCQTILVDDDKEKFPEGGAYVVNFNQGDIRFIIGEHKGTLKRAMFNGYEMPKNRDDYNMAPVKFWLENKGSWNVANESMLRFLPGIRYMFIAYVDPMTKRPTLRTLTDQ